MKTLVISDVHIGSKGCQTDAILNLLKEKYDRYILVGDIIDGWLFKKYKNHEAYNFYHFSRFGFFWLCSK